ncbi:glycosyltransferase [Flavivirga spongiicola]|uniref:Glycosyltransferase n=1 Tax=Flavivirga spongiicola TaxID=421621 RepID=A0ABU7XNI1_9FLAO|nr:glycosyltransferase [Flavivirga sp. MEBiC05379]MDO5981662.1 glycosyltransferase [Flavivirga sp. MEBiC05379]
MRVLLVSMPSVHFFRWIENLPSDYLELYWYNITGEKFDEKNDKFKEVSVYNNKRKISYLKGEYLLSKKLPFYYQKLRHFVEVTENEDLEHIIQKLKPDIIHSFEMQSCSYPILKTMNKNKELDWIYSCWGSDLYYYKQFSSHKRMIKKVLKRVDYLITDCKRDYNLARTLDFKGKHLGVIPGGSGYNINELINNVQPFEKRNIILIKGYQHTFGRAINIVKAIESIAVNQINPYKIIVFGAHEFVVNYVKKKKLDFETYHRHQLQHGEVIKLMGKSLIYIGNSTSDGIPNTLLEAITMGAFPIQSNPGRVSEEIINNGENGLLINDPEDISEIKNAILAALHTPDKLKEAFSYNLEFAKKNLDKEIIKQKIYDAYLSVIEK